MNNIIKGFGGFDWSFFSSKARKNKKLVKEKGSLESQNTDDSIRNLVQEHNTENKKSSNGSNSWTGFGEEVLIEEYDYYGIRRKETLKAQEKAKKQADLNTSNESDTGRTISWADNLYLERDEDGNVVYSNLEKMKQFFTKQRNLRLNKVDFNKTLHNALKGINTGITSTKATICQYATSVFEKPIKKVRTAECNLKAQEKAKKQADLKMSNESDTGRTISWADNLYLERDEDGNVVYSNLEKMKQFFTKQRNLRLNKVDFNKTLHNALKGINTGITSTKATICQYVTSVFENKIKIVKHNKSAVITKAENVVNKVEPQTYNGEEVVFYELPKANVVSEIKSQKKYGLKIFVDQIKDKKNYQFVKNDNKTFFPYSIKRKKIDEKQQCIIVVEKTKREKVIDFLHLDDPQVQAYWIKGATVASLATVIGLSCLAPVSNLVTNVKTYFNANDNVPNFSMTTSQHDNSLASLSKDTPRSYDTPSQRSQYYAINKEIYGKDKVINIGDEVILTTDAIYSSVEDASFGINPKPLSNDLNEVRTVEGVGVNYYDTIYYTSYDYMVKGYLANGSEQSACLIYRNGELEGYVSSSNVKVLHK